MILMATTLLEGTTGLYTFTLVNEDGEGIAVSSIETMTLTAYDWATQAILNNREAQDVMNVNDVTIVTEAGPPVVTTVTWRLQPADTIIATPGKACEVHEAYFTWTWNSGTRTGVHGPIRYAIENLPLVTV
jgi:hypothetical protein